MAASALDRTHTQPLPAGLAGLADLSALSDLPPRVERDVEEAAPAAPSLADLAGLPAAPERDAEEVVETPDAPAASAPARSGPDLSDLGGLGTTLEREGEPEDAPRASPTVTAAPAAAAPSGGFADLAGLGTTLEREGDPDDAPAPVIAVPSAPSAPGAPRQARTTRQVPQTPAAPAAAGDEATLEAYLRNNQDALAARPHGAEAVSGVPASADADTGAYPTDGSGDPGGIGEGQPGEEPKADEPAPIEIEPLRPEAPVDPDALLAGHAHPAHVIEAALRELAPDPANLPLLRRWQDINTGMSDRYDVASNKYREAMEALRAGTIPAPAAAGGLEGAAGGRYVRGGGLISIGRTLASLGRRGVEARRRAAVSNADDELARIRGEFDEQATNHLRDLFSTKSRHYADRLGELDLQHGGLSDAVGRYNRAFATSAAAAPFLAAVEAYGQEKGLSGDAALADAAAGKAGPAVAAALESVRGATLADPAVVAARAEMREAEETFSDTARRAGKDYESMLRFAGSDDAFDAEATSRELREKIGKLAEATPAPVAEEEGKAKMAERMRELAESIERMIREMFDRLFKAVTGTFGR